MPTNRHYSLIISVLLLFSAFLLIPINSWARGDCPEGVSPINNREQLLDNIIQYLTNETFKGALHEGRLECYFQGHIDYRNRSGASITSDTMDIHDVDTIHITQMFTEIDNDYELFISTGRRRSVHVGWVSDSVTQQYCKINLLIAGFRASTQPTRAMPMTAKAI